MKIQRVKILALLLLAAPLTSFGCHGAGNESVPAMPAMGNLQPYTEPEERRDNPGSIFSESAPGLLFEDSRARRVGDIILIKIVEKTTASNQADTTSDRTTTVDLNVGAAFGRSTISPALFGGFLAGKVGPDPVVSAGSASKHDTSGKTTRQNTVSTTIGGRVINVLPNGVLEVAGAREIKVNTETEYMVVRGLVRGSDVLSDNTVLSTQMANASIEYYGKGAISDKQNPGWLSRVLDMVWPF